LLLTELAFQNEEKKIGQLNYCCIPNLFSDIEKRKTGSRIVANTELTFQNKEKKTSCRISCCHTELAFQNEEKKIGS
jgi:hypothetical protein